MSDQVEVVTVRRAISENELPPEIRRAFREREREKAHNAGEIEELSSEQEEVRVRKGLSKKDIPEEARRKIRKLND